MPLPRQAKRHKHPLEHQLVVLALLASVPLMMLCLWSMLASGVSIWLICLTLFSTSLLISYCAVQIYKRSVYQFRSLSNLLDAMVQGDYSMRARHSQGEGALDQLSAGINELSQRLMNQRTQSEESQKLLHTVMAHIDVAVIALDENSQLTMVNDAATQLFSLASTEQQQALVQQLEFTQELVAGEHQVRDLRIGQRQGKYKVHVERFREAGKPHQLLFITDVHSMLRSEQSQAWQSLVRVISHEINNSLSPIASISATLAKMIKNHDDCPAARERLVDGLSIISQRAKGLGEFAQSYRQLAKLPPPEQAQTPLTPLLERVTRLFPQQTFDLHIPTDAMIWVDTTQFEQVLINLLKNAVEATTDEKQAISIAGEQQEMQFVLSIRDQGCGIANPENLFVPFYTTKKEGSGIGLLLSRQIVEGHKGRLSLANNADGGCSATLEIPLA